MIFFTLLGNDLRMFFREWKAVALLLVSPFLMILLFVFVLSPYLDRSNFIDPFPIAVADMENSSETRIVIRQLKAVEVFSDVIVVSEKGARDLIRSNKAAAAIVIPDDFSRMIANRRKLSITVYYNKSMPIQSLVVKNLVISAINLLTAGRNAIDTIYHYNAKLGLDGDAYSASVMDITLKALARNEIFERSEGMAQFDLTPAEYFTAALIVVFLMFAGMPGMKMLVGERNSGLTGRLLSTPVTRAHIILSKFCVSFILSGVQFVIVVLMTAVISGNYWGAPVKSILALFGAVIFSVSAWSVLVSAISKTLAAADVIGNLGILLMAVAGGSIYPLSSMPSFVRAVSRFTINRWAMEGFMVLFSGDRSLGIAGHVTILLLMGGALLILSIFAMRFAGREGGIR